MDPGWAKCNKNFYSCALLSYFNCRLDKTLQDIVYKLVPELFVREMTRRQKFYQQHPEAAAKATPEERGVDTERTIYNPNDTISLSMEYIR